MQLKPLVHEFLEYLEVEKNYSNLTVKAYGYDLRGWLDYLKQSGVTPEMNVVTTGHVRKFIAELRSSGLKPATVARRLNAIRSFWGYLMDCEYTDTNPCRRISAPKKEQTLPVYLTEDEVNALLDATEKNHFADLAFRDCAVLSVFIHTGIRRGELLSLRLRDVDMNQRLLFVRKGKGSKERTIPISDQLYEVLADYLEVRPDASHDHLFSTRDKRPLGRTGLTALFKKAVQNSGIQRPGVTIHKLRHTFATMLLRSGCDIVSIQRLLGHNSLETTAIYMHTDMGSLRNAVEKLPSFGD